MRNYIGNTVNDFIRTGDFKGYVIRLNIGDTHLKTPDGKDVYVPNAQFIKIPSYQLYH